MVENNNSHYSTKAMTWRLGDCSWRKEQSVSERAETCCMSERQSV